MKTAVILINWNSLDDTLACLDSIRRGIVCPDTIFVWDNASQKDPSGPIQKVHPDVVVHRSYENIGFAEANNRAASALIKSGADLIWVLNNDTEVQLDCLAELQRGLQAHPDAAAVTAKMWQAPPGRILWYAGGETAGCHFTAIHRGMGEPDAGQHDHPCAVSFMSGCCMLIRAESLRRHGLFDPSFFAYCEDLDWGLRVMAAGEKLYYIPSATLHHKVSSSLRKSEAGIPGTCTPMQHFLMARNQLWVIRRHARGWRRRSSGVAAFVLRRLGYAAGNAAWGRFNKTAAILRGLVQGLFVPVSRELFQSGSFLAGGS